MTRLAIALALLLAGCGPAKPSTEANIAADENQTVTANSPQNVEVTEAPAPLPPANAGLRFVGRWATSEANCAAQPWQFSADRLTATDGPHCSIYKVSEAPGGYDLAARCPAKQPNELDLIKLRFAESARAMLVESNVIPPTGLIYCGK
jgi:hypothetical protein